MILSGLSILFGIIFVISLLGGNIFLLSFLHWICFGDLDTSHGLNIVPANGWISTIGLTGMKMWNQSFIGAMGSPLINAGVIGFTGIKLLVDDDFTYLGSALFVKIESY